MMPHITHTPRPLAFQEPAPPVVILSGSTDPEFARQLTDAGAALVLLKPLKQSAIHVLMALVAPRLEECTEPTLNTSSGLLRHPDDVLDLDHIGVSSATDDAHATPRMSTGRRNSSFLRLLELVRRSGSLLSAFAGDAKQSRLETARSTREWLAAGADSAHAKLVAVSVESAPQVVGHHKTASSSAASETSSPARKRKWKLRPTA